MQEKTAYLGDVSHDLKLLIYGLQWVSILNDNYNLFLYNCVHVHHFHWNVANVTQINFAYKFHRESIYNEAAL